MPYVVLAAWDARGWGTVSSPQGFLTCVLLLVIRYFSKALGHIMLCKQIKLMEKGLMGREENRT